MPLKESSGNMYDFARTWNPVKGLCPYGCVYCYVKRIFNRFRKDQQPLRMDEQELHADLGAGNCIFICSGCDLFHPGVPDEWVKRIVIRANTFDNKYLWHTKNPMRAVELLPESTDFVLCATIESNVYHPDISKAPAPYDRVMALKNYIGERMITAEPIMDFDLPEFTDMILSCNPVQVNIGADSGNNHLPEPTPEKLRELIARLEPHTKVHLKKNIRRLMK